MLRRRLFTMKRLEAEVMKIKNGLKVVSVAKSKRVKNVK